MNGKDGKDGENGIAPVVRINMENFHWEISMDGGISWTDTGVTAMGKNGVDAIAPIVRINTTNYHWEISTDGGLTWSDTGIIALGQNGKDAIPAMFRIDALTNSWEISYDGGHTWEATGMSAKGENGANAISPQLRINAETFEWEVSTDGGTTWGTTGVVAKGIDGTDGDAFFKSVVIRNGYVTFELLDGSTFMFKMDTDVVTPRLLSIGFLASANPSALVEDIFCDIIGDSIVECWVHHIMDNKKLIPHFTIDGDMLLADNDTLFSDVSPHDFKEPVTVQVRAGELTKNYKVYVHAYTGLPVLYIETEGRADIVSRHTYVNAHFRLQEDVVTRGAGDVVECDGLIKGRGNTTWGMPKKPYRLKFNEEVSLLDEHKDKSWVLLANYFDKTSLRTATAFYMGSISNLDYTPRFHFVDVMLNGRYNGTYQLGDKLKISKHRVNVGNDGALMEIDNRASSDDDARYFTVPHIPNPINIKEPEVEYDDDIFNYARDFVTQTDSVLFSANFKDPENGWQKYMDMDSFVDWYLINEIARNNDAIFFTSCFMNLKRDEKLKMGPLWDFDLGFGNVIYNENYEPEGFWVRKSLWYYRLFQDPAFVARVKERFNYFYEHQNDILNDINQNAQYLHYSVIENDLRWGTLYNETWANHDVWGSYKNEVQFMKMWIQKRFEWLKIQFDAM